MTDKNKKTRHYAVAAHIVTSEEAAANTIKIASVEPYAVTTNMPRNLQAYINCKQAEIAGAVIGCHNDITITSTAEINAGDVVYVFFFMHVRTEDATKKYNKSVTVRFTNDFTPLDAETLRAISESVPDPET